MVDREAEAFLSYHCLTAPLICNPVTEGDNIINRLRLKYRTYRVEFEGECGAVMIPNCFAGDFGDEIDRYAVLVDKNNREFEMRVERINIKKIRSRIKQKVNVPVFIPPIRFAVEKSDLPQPFHNGFPASIMDLSYRHDPAKFQIYYEKNLTSSDVATGCLMLDNKEFCELVLDKKSTTVALIDDCGNKWVCVVIFGTRPDTHIRLEGQWKRMVDARMIQPGAYMKIGVPALGNKKDVYYSARRI